MMPEIVSQILPPMMGDMIALILVGILSYLLGSIPFGIVMARLFGLGDLRKIGSGNIGATNVLRTGHKPAAFLTLILDAGKGAIAVLIATWAYESNIYPQIAGLAAFFGHCFPIFLRFKGGKGVATYLGTLLALAFPVGLAACATWLVSAVLFRISSLAALISAALAGLWAYLLGYQQLVGLCLALFLLIFWRHQANIARLLRGEEPKIGGSKQK